MRGSVKRSLLIRLINGCELLNFLYLRNEHDSVHIEGTIVNWSFVGSSQTSTSQCREVESKKQEAHPFLTIPPPLWFLQWKATREMALDQKGALQNFSEKTFKALKAFTVYKSTVQGSRFRFQSAVFVVGWTTRSLDSRSLRLKDP